MKRFHARLLGTDYFADNEFLVDADDPSQAANIYVHAVKKEEIPVEVFYDQGLTLHVAELPAIRDAGILDWKSLEYIKYDWLSLVRENGYEAKMIS